MFKETSYLFPQERGITSRYWTKFSFSMIEGYQLPSTPVGPGGTAIFTTEFSDISTAMKNLMESTKADKA